jgi:hypothetical protein
MKTETQAVVLDTASAAGKVLTVYLHINQGAETNLNRRFETLLATQFAAIERTFEEEEERREFATVRAIVEEFIAHYKPAARTLALFADSTGILLSRDLMIDISTEVRWGRPHIQPYLDALDEYERHIVVVTDSWQARIFSVFLGSVESSVDVRDTPHTTHIHAAGMDHLESQAQFQRRADENTKRHLKHVVREIETMLEHRPANRIVCGGNLEAVAALFRLLPKHLKTRVVGSVPMSLADSTDRILKTALQSQVNAERHFELKGVLRLQEAAAKRNRAVTGINATLAVLREGRAFSVYYSEDLQLSGGECEHCDALFPDTAGGVCGYCGMALRSVTDLMDAILDKALRAGAHVEQVRGDGARKLMESGGIGAFLRY